MTLERKLLVVAGALIVAFIIAIGSFSLGLYIGQHGIFPQAPRPAGPGRPPQLPAGPDQPAANIQPPPGDPGPPAPADRPANLPPGPPDLIGPLRAADSTGLTIGARQGAQLVRVNAKTEVFDAQGKKLPLEALSVGNGLAVFGHFTDDRQAMIAETIIILPPPDNPRPRQ